MMASSTTPDITVPGTIAVPVTIGDWVAAGVYTSSVSGSGAEFGVNMKFAFVKTGPTGGGTATVPSGQAAYVRMGDSSGAYVYISGSATFNAVSCTTQDVPVELGKWPTNDFADPGYTNRDVSFNIRLNNCPAGMSAIKYRIDPVTAVIDSDESVVALDTGGAEGMGVQLLDSTGTAAFPLSTVKTFNDYNASTGGSYVIPFKARYYQHLPKEQVKPGTANSSMTFTMIYE